MVRVLIKKRYLSLIISLIIILFFSVDPHYGQGNNMSEAGFGIQEKSLKQDTVVKRRQKKLHQDEQPDTNFTYEKYAAFLTKISDTSKYIVLPLNEFRKTLNPGKIVVGLRHDVDNDLDLANQFSEIESDLGFRSTYFILHTASYYLENPANMEIHSEKIIPILKSMQNERYFEIGWHNDLVTLQAVYNIDPVAFLHKELGWLRGNGINIYGTASHGSNYCYIYKYLNYYFFEEFTYPVVGQFVNNVTLPIGGKEVPMKKGRLSDFGLEYEAYFLNNNKYFSDATITSGKRWNIGMLDINELQAGDRVIILLHPIHWHKAAIDANIESFEIVGQKSSSVDAANSTITVEMPSEANKNSLIAGFILSPGAYVKVSDKLQVNGTTVNNFSSPLIYTVYAENRDVHKEWIVYVKNAKNYASSFETFEVSGLTSAVNINSLKKTISVEVNEVADLQHLQVQFKLSSGATAWIGNDEQFSNTGTVDFTKSVQYKVLAEDGISSSVWTVTVSRKTDDSQDIMSSYKGLFVYPNPSDGKFHLQFQNVENSPSSIEIYNTSGEKVYTDVIKKSGSFKVDADLSKLPAGVYILRFSHSEKPVKIIIRKR
jgi:hypothetical protein